MKAIRNDYCIKQFVSGEDIRPALQEVSLKDGNIYATNGHIAVKIKAGLCMHKYKEVEKFPDVEKVISEHISKEKRVLSIDTLFDDLMKIECCFKPKMIYCDNCDGLGVDTCDYCDSQHDCKDCNGKGEKPSEELELTGEHDCMIFKKRYRLKYLDLIIRTAVYTGVKEIQISNSTNEYSGTIFEVGDFTILLMPKYVQK